ncbi:MAG: hypothetical protein H0U69_03340 [Trueperaceae bacterium]|nr:hypothetical protein [Trueperaceae bacterium]
MPMAARKRRALEQLDLAYLEVDLRGPEGQQVSYDEKGKRVSGKARTDYIGFKKRIERLQVEAGLVDRDLLRIVEEIKRQDRFFGEATTGLKSVDG